MNKKTRGSIKQKGFAHFQVPQGPSTPAAPRAKGYTSLADSCWWMVYGRHPMARVQMRVT